MADPFTNGCWEYHNLINFTGSEETELFWIRNTKKRFRLWLFSTGRAMNCVASHRFSAYGRITNVLFGSICEDLVFPHKSSRTVANRCGASFPRGPRAAALFAASHDAGCHERRRGVHNHKF